MSSFFHPTSASEESHDFLFVAHKYTIARGKAQRCYQRRFLMADHHSKRWGFLYQEESNTMGTNQQKGRLPYSNPTYAAALTIYLSGTSLFFLQGEQRRDFRTVDESCKDVETLHSPSHPN